MVLVGLLASWAPAEDMTPAVAEHVRRATVMVLTEIPGSNEGGSGSGEFINENGLLITNNHVVDPNHGKTREERAKSFGKLTLPKYRIIVDSGTRREKVYDAELLFQSEPTDLALLQLKKGPKEGEVLTRHFMRFGPEGTLREGLKTWVFGFPGGLSRGKEVAETFGLITELLRSQSGLVHYVESDATVHPGNSGGPFVDANGYLIGVATHKRFSEGEKDRSGAVPVHMVMGFLRTAFYEDRVPASASVLPFVDIFTDQDGVVEFPNYMRDSQASTIYYRSGDQVRRGRILAEKLTVPTRLGPMSVDLSKAAYLFASQQEATLIMDGGDYLRFSSGKKKLPVEFSGNKTDVPIASIATVSFPRRREVVTYPHSQGVIVEADGTRLGLWQIEGGVSVGGSSYQLSKVASVVQEKEGRRMLRTTDGQCLPGKVGGDAIRARVIWSDDPIAFSLAEVSRAAVRPVDWTYVSAKGRRLIDRLEFDNEKLEQVAELLDSPNWQEARSLLAQAEQAGRRNRAVKRQLKLLRGVEKWRGGEYQSAAAVFKGLRNERDQVRWTAESYLLLLEAHPEGDFRGEQLSEPEVAWRSSTYMARRVLDDARRRLEQARKLEYDKQVKELKKIEGELEAANRLELGIAQSLLMEVLRAQLQAHYEGYQQMVARYEELVQEHNRQRFRAQQHKYARKLKSLNKKIERAVKEGQRLYERLSADVTGFVVEPPQFDQHRR